MAVQDCFIFTPARMGTALQEFHSLEKSIRMSDPKLLPEPTAKETVPPRNELDDLFDLIGGIEDADIQEKLAAARKYNDDIRHSCKVILAEADRYFSEGNAEIRRLAQDKDELTVKVRQLMRDMNGQTKEQTLQEIRNLLHTDDGDWADHKCPTCECWTTKDLEIDPEKEY